jgi:hypothetical protein
MKKLLLFILLASAITAAKAQTPNAAITEHDPAIKAKDVDVKTKIIDPAEKDAGDDAPDWDELNKTITTKYDAVTADRTITKAKIYYYYNKDWPSFCDGILYYTDNWELANDYKLLNGNAVMILQNSADQAQLKEAQKWAKMAMDGDANNADYKTTYQAITDKLAGK